MSRRSLQPSLSLLASLPAFLACASSGVSYSGDSQRKLLDPERLVTGDQAPAGQRRLGHLSAGCKLADARSGLDGVAFSDVACSTALLEAALRERAAEAGGTLLVDLSCDPEAQTLETGSRARCSADVWGPVDPARYVVATEPVPVNVDPHGPAAPLAPAYGSVEEAWRVRLDFWPAPNQKGRQPVGSEQVAEIDFPRVGFVRLGDVRARAAAECSSETLRAALRAAAARAGGTSVVDVRCVTGDGDRSCVASVAAPEVEGPVAEVR